MTNKKDLILLNPEQIKNFSCKNKHLFGCYINIYGGVSNIDRNSICSAVERDNPISSTGLDKYEYYKTNEDIRISLAKKENKGDKICGNCVRILYSDDD